MSQLRTLPHPPNYEWKPQPEAQAIVTDLLRAHLESSALSRRLAERMRDAAGARFGDWVDFVVAPASESLRARLASTGFVSGFEAAPGYERFEHEGALFPTVLLAETPGVEVGIKVDAVVDFLAAWDLEDVVIEGAPLAPMRRACVARADGAALWVVERRGYPSMLVPEWSDEKAAASLEHLEAFVRRPRRLQDEARAFAETRALIDAAAAELGTDYAADLFFRAERRYWQKRNRAARVQFARQDALGLGWANHDHHTYRCTRRNFPRVIETLEALGFVCRERFYAGAEAGWGAQVLEQPVAKFVIFADVDMDPHEVQGDFAHEGFVERDGLGTVGLWCALHGESMLEAGMHHLECQFDHAALVEQLGREGVGTMPPFTNFPFLRQAFTEGERWPVDPARIEALVARGLISVEQAEGFRRHGAIGSHLENLERNDGYKGFNQQGVSDIISRTDPRKHGSPAGA